MITLEIVYYFEYFLKEIKISGNIFCFKFIALIWPSWGSCKYWTENYDIMVLCTFCVKDSTGYMILCWQWCHYDLASGSVCVHLFCMCAYKHTLCWHMSFEKVSWGCVDVSTNIEIVHTVDQVSSITFAQVPPNLIWSGGKCHRGTHFLLFSLFLHALEVPHTVL